MRKYPSSPTGLFAIVLAVVVGEFPAAFAVSPTLDTPTDVYPSVADAPVRYLVPQSIYGQQYADPQSAGQRPLPAFQQPPLPPIVPLASDRAITDRVQKELYLDPDVPLANVHVDTLAGIVTLRGTVGSLADRGRAGALAAATPGVHGVVNDLQVSASGVPADREVARDVGYVLRDADRLLFRGVRVRVDSGVAYLSGTVDSETTHDLARRYVETVPGVQTIKDSIRLVSYTAPPDEQIHKEILDTLPRMALVNPAGIRIDVRHGHVRFTGAAASIEERERLARMARVAGATAVDVSALAIPSPFSEEAAIPQRNPAPSPLDWDIGSAIDRAVLGDPRLNTFPVRASVVGQVVTLRGAVDSAVTRQLAGDIAARVPGARGVVNRLEIRPRQQIHDRMRLEQLLTLLGRERAIRLGTIRPSVVDGVIYLRGSVATEAERRLAERLAREIPGATAIRNELTVQAAPTALRPPPPIR